MAFTPKSPHHSELFFYLMQTAEGPSSALFTLKSEKKRFPLSLTVVPMSGQEKPLRPLVYSSSTYMTVMKADLLTGTLHSL